MSWQRASMAEAAVTLGGTLTPSFGSISATRGRRNSLRMLALNFFSGRPMTALRVASAPVPAVVGMAIQGAVEFADAGDDAGEAVVFEGHWGLEIARRVGPLSRKRTGPLRLCSCHWSWGTGSSPKNRGLCLRPWRGWAIQSATACFQRR